MIQEDVFNSDIDVSVALESYLDKVCTMLEYAGYTDYADDLISEMFDIYLEATDRRKKADEIDKYLADNAIANAKSKSPQKARQARQVRNFLMTQDFDPKTGTIKSDYKDENGKNPRTGLKFNKRDDSHSVSIIKSKRPEINLTNETLKGNAANRALTMSHEKGHDMFSRNGKNAQWSKGEDYNKNERGIKFINQAKAAGKSLNDHDTSEYIVQGNGGSGSSPEELEADLHGAKTARVRTKYAGNKKAVKRSGATRNVNDNEIARFYINISKAITKSFNKAKMVLSLYSAQLKACKQLINLAPIIDKVRDKNLTKEDARKYMSIINNNNMFRILIDRSNNDVKEYQNLLTDINITKDTIKEGKDLISNNEMTDSAKKSIESMIKTLENQLNEYENKFEKFKKIEDTFRVSENYIGQCITSLHKSLEYYIQDDINPSLTDMPDSEILKRHLEKITKNFNDQQSLMQKYHNDLSAANKMIRKQQQDYVNFKVDDSTQMRNDFVKQYLHEYFIEFMTEYYSAIFNESLQVL